MLSFYIIVEYITLKVNSVICSTIKFLYHRAKGEHNMDAIDRIRALREDNDMNQAAIAKLLNVGQKTYSDYELRKIRIPLDSVIILARFYNVDMNYICGLSDAKKALSFKIIGKPSVFTFGKAAARRKCFGKHNS